MRHLLWIDACAAGSSGVLLLALRGWLSEWYRIPTEVLAFMGIVSLVYCAFGLTLAPRRRKPPALVRVLIGANFVWAGACLVGALAFFDGASSFGVAALAIEAGFVAGLATLERRHWYAIVGDA